MFVCLNENHSLPLCSKGSEKKTTSWLHQQDSVTENCTLFLWSTKLLLISINCCVWCYLCLYLLMVWTKLLFHWHSLTKKWQKTKEDSHPINACSNWDILHLYECVCLTSKCVPKHNELQTVHRTCGSCWLFRIHGNGFNNRFARCTSYQRKEKKNEHTVEKGEENN